LVIARSATVRLPERVPAPVTIVRRPLPVLQPLATSTVPSAPNSMVAVTPTGTLDTTSPDTIDSSVQVRPVRGTSGSATRRSSRPIEVVPAVSVS
jgi:hypothetical protein